MTSFISTVSQSTTKPVHTTSTILSSSSVKTTTSASKAQWIAVGSIAVTDPVQVAAILTVPACRTATQNAIVANITSIILSKVIRFCVYFVSMRFVAFFSIFYFSLVFRVRRQWEN
jgi:hypothetical protein